MRVVLAGGILVGFCDRCGRVVGIDTGNVLLVGDFVRFSPISPLFVSGKVCFCRMR